MTTIAPENDKYLSATQVKGRYADASDMWLYRRKSDGSGFPAPLIMQGRKYWKLSDLVAWEHAVAKRDEKTPNPHARGVGIVRERSKRKRARR